jgi:flagellar hook assembly protein FlgD
MTISYSVPEAGHVLIDVYDQNGSIVHGLVDEVIAAGRHSFFWDGRDENGRVLADGVYVVTLKINGRIIHKTGMAYVLRN